ncbi:hypothetical protein BGZ65_002665 [Modicella reniformis]|uniref:F-box domain-containing protein n=1 Tax=Modicella reniformis TaxID=1440133 RepID=A0A9P6IKZ2_9FUNG|nr:hypothetical protein BGZ65_002665 [Modicella reniformis]
MQSTHPLEIPEIVSQVASYVRKHTLKGCALVSTTWYQAFNPLIWRDISWKNARPFLEAIHPHTQLVRTFKADHGINERRKEFLDLRFPNLVSLDLPVTPLEEDTKEWVLGHSSLTFLRLRGNKLSSVFWNTLLGFRHLEDLTVFYPKLSRKDIDTFWQLCTHLERLELFHPEIPHPGNMFSLEFPSIKEFKLRYVVYEVEIFFLKFMQRCPSLTSLWVDGVHNLEFTSSFSELVAARTWPHLHSITIESHKITSEALSKIIGGMQQITALDITCRQGVFAPDFMELLRPHFSNIRVLHLRSDNDTISLMVQEILASCPLLEQLTAPPIDASVVAEGKPWVCTKLQKLRLMFVYKRATYEGSTLSGFRPLVFDQLARLVRLEEWCMDNSNWNFAHQVFELTLGNGLDKLSTLRSLRSISLGNTNQNMGQQEIYWILKHWTNLENFKGYLNTRNSSLNETLKKRLNEHGITGW